MSARWFILAGVAAGVLAWWFLGDPEATGVLGELRQIFTDAVGAVTKGRRLTRCPYNKTTGVVDCDPEALAQLAGLDLETYALARMIASEEGGSTTSVQALVAHAVQNNARIEGTSIARLLLRAKAPAHAGKFGTQGDLEITFENGRHPSDRYASTGLDPYEGHAAVARGVIDGSIPDLTGGANQFDRTGGLRDPEAVAAKRMAAGSTLVEGLEGIDGIGDLRFWARGAG